MTAVTHAPAADTTLAADASTEDLAASLRLSVTRLARLLRQQSDAGLTPTQLAALATAARALDTTAEFNPTAASSSDATSVSATTVGGASRGGYDIQVTRLAREQRTQSNTFASATTALGLSVAACGGGLHRSRCGHAGAQLFQGGRLVEDLDLGGGLEGQRGQYQGHGMGDAGVHGDAPYWTRCRLVGRLTCCRC